MQTSDLFSKKSFSGLFISQATGAFNDNALKMILVGVILATRPTSEHDQYLALLNALIIAPFVFLAPIAGWFSDRFSKRRVLLTFKGTEFIILSLAMASLYTGQFWILLVLLLCMGTQSAFYSPAKYGILKEIVENKRMGQANGLIQMGTILAIILGTVGGSLLYDTFKSPTGNQSLVWPLTILSAISLTGFFFTSRVERVASRSGAVFQFRDFLDNLAELKTNRKLKLTVTGICYFWFTAMLLNLLLILFGTQEMGMKTVTEASLLFLYLSAGVAVGSLAAAKASRFGVELGLIPAGSIGMGAALILLPYLAGSYPLVALGLVATGFSGGMFLVPLNTMLQMESKEDKRGRFIAITNMLDNLGMLLSSVVLTFLSSWLNFSPGNILSLLGLASMAVSIYIFFLLPEALLRFCLGILTHTLYRIKTVNPENIPERGGVLLTPNHMSFVDGLVLQHGVPHRKIRFLVHREYFDKPVVGWILKTGGCIPVSPKGSREAISKVSDSLTAGETVCLFPEGSITRTGLILPFKRGIELILKKVPDDVKVTPVYFDKLWGSIFSFQGKKFFRKIPARIPYPVTVLFGSPENRDITAFELRQRVTGLGADAFSWREKEYKPLPVYFIKTAKRLLFRKAVADQQSGPVTYLGLLIKSLFLSSEIQKRSGPREMIGIAIPASTLAVLANIAVSLAGRVAVNLNFKAVDGSMAKAVEKCEIKTVLASRVFMEKVADENPGRFLCLEDLLGQTPLTRKALLLISALFLPASFLFAFYYKGKSCPGETATVIFPGKDDSRGVELTHSNIMANSEMVHQVFHFLNNDRILGILPFYQSFGFTTTFWLPILKGIFTVYAPNPLDPKKVEDIAENYQTTIMLATPSLYKLYARANEKEGFKDLRVAISGGEKLDENVAREFFEKFGVRLSEGYGTAEMSPVISCNVPDYHKDGLVQTGTKQGSVGVPLPGVTAKVVDPDDYGLELPQGREGMLLVKGVSRMKGYLKDKKSGDMVFHNGWYITGDTARIDEDGFIFIV